MFSAYVQSSQKKNKPTLCYIARLIRELPNQFLYAKAGFNVKSAWV